MNRRDFFKTAAVGAATLSLPLLGRSRADGKKYAGPYFLLIHAGGGWDPTMVCDPKGGTIDKLFKTEDIKSAGAIRYAPLSYYDGGGNVVFTNQQFFDKWNSKLLVINGLDTTTGNHDTGTRCMWSGRVTDGYPTFAAVVAAARSPGNALGFISNGGYEQTAGLSPLTRLGGVDIVRRIAYPNRLDPNNPTYLVHTPATLDRIQRMQRERLDDMRKGQALPRIQHTMGSLYDARASNGDLATLAAALPPQSTIDKAWNPLHRQALVAIAGFQAGLAVAANLTVGGFDTHGDHDNQQRYALYWLMTGVDLILDELKKQMLDDKVIVVVGSDFGRTPAYNAQNGKDHWNITSMMLSAGIPMGKVIGATDDSFKAVSVNRQTLAPDPNGRRIGCDNVQQALRKLAGIDKSDAAAKFPLGADADMPLFG